jgi:hypothetical protein
LKNWLKQLLGFLPLDIALPIVAKIGLPLAHFVLGQQIGLCCFTVQGTKVGGSILKIKLKCQAWSGLIWCYIDI